MMFTKIYSPYLFAKFSVLVLTIMIFSGHLAAKNLNAYLSYTVFDSPAEGPYIETYLSVAGNSVKFIPTSEGKYQASIEILTLFKKGEEVINYDKYELFSPVVDDTLAMDFNFLDVQRYSLPLGVYEYELQIRDVNSDAKPYINVQPLELAFSSEKINFSGIQLVDSYEKTIETGILSKNGYDLVPYLINFYPAFRNKITFYSEIYNSQKILGENEQYLVTYFIASTDHNKPIEQYIKFKKETTAPVNVVFSEFDITNLKSGNYFLTLQIKDRENNLLSSNQLFFQRSNPRIKFNLDDLADFDPAKTFVGGINNIDTLKQYIRYIEPISDMQEQSFIEANINSTDRETMQKFFYKFWLSRDNLEPRQAWEDYLHEVNKVNLAYSTPISKGFDTDRGRIYLKYGPPNSISENYNEPSAYPYEIWHYYEMKDGQRNKRFVFYAEDIVTNDFALLHSDAIGEISNYRWQYLLNKRVDAGYDLDRPATIDSWGSESKKYYDLPR
ncbi:MAG: GWxTD domain-containing protein [Bacteroidales bacterium]